MGCASSNPIVQGGKQLVETAKDSVTEAVNKGEHVLHNAGEAAKEGMEHVKEAVGTAVTSAEAGLESMVEKVSDSFSSTKKEAESVAEETKTKVEDESNTAIATAMETISDAETIVASEADNAKDFMVRTRTAVLKSKMDDIDLKNEFGEAVTIEDDEEDEEIGKKGCTANETGLQLEDLEDGAPLGDIVQSNYKCMKKKAEDLMAGSGLPPAIEPETQIAMEEPPLLIRYRHPPCRRRRSGKRRPTPSSSKGRDTLFVSIPNGRTTTTKTRTRRSKKDTRFIIIIIITAETRHPPLRRRTIRKTPSPSVWTPKNPFAPLSKANYSRKSISVRRKSSSIVKIYRLSRTRAKFNPNFIYKIWMFTHYTISICIYILSIFDNRSGR